MTHPCTSLDNWDITWLKNVQFLCAMEEEKFQYQGTYHTVLYHARGHSLITIRKLNYNFVLKALFNSQLLEYTFSRQMQSCVMAKSLKQHFNRCTRKVDTCLVQWLFYVCTLAINVQKK